MGVTCYGSKVEVVSREAVHRGHNIPHYANVDRVADAGFGAQPFIEPQTIFDMPVQQTITRRLAEYERAGVQNPQNPYDESKAIFDGIAAEASYQRASSGRNLVGAWIAAIGDASDLAIPNPVTQKCDVSLHSGTPIRLSIAGSNAFGVGGGLQIEMRVPLDELERHAIFKGR